ncbi:MAG: uracil phosphoribosyltransferase [Thermostichales cyanobacterium SZTDM-1c_bins_54]
MAERLLIHVPPHPLLRHWLTVARDAQTPMPLFRAAMTELGRWLTYEACRDWLPTLPVTVETPLAPASGEILDGEAPIGIVPILRAGLAMLEGCQSILSGARVFHVGMARDEQTLVATCYLNRLPQHFAPNTRILIPEPMIATGGTLVTLLRDLVSRGIDPSLVRIITVLAAPPGLQKIGAEFPQVQIYAAMIDEALNDRGFIVPGLGDAGDRAFGTGH